VGAIGPAAHAAAKGAVTSFAKSLAAEGATPAIEEAFKDEIAVNCVLQMQLIQRAGTGEDIAALALYLASDESSFVTG
jgi:meso-butanediol dehydrogenase / (S,S)-butanediol dehydrogenase / diacetyl reductase